MREAAAILFLILLVLIGWKQPFRVHYHHVVGTPDKAAAARLEMERAVAQRITRQIQAAAPTPARDRSWMFEGTKMDAPYNKAKIR